MSLRLIKHPNLVEKIELDLELLIFHNGKFIRKKDVASESPIKINPVPYGDLFMKYFWTEGIYYLNGNLKGQVKENGIKEWVSDVAIKNNYADKVNAYSYNIIITPGTLETACIVGAQLFKI